MDFRLIFFLRALGKVHRKASKRLIWEKVISEICEHSYVFCLFFWRSARAVLAWIFKKSQVSSLRLEPAGPGLFRIADVEPWILGFGGWVLKARSRYSRPRAKQLGERSTIRRRRRGTLRRCRSGSTAGRTIAPCTAGLKSARMRKD